MTFLLSKFGLPLALVAALAGVTWYCTGLLEQLGEAEAQQVMLAGDLAASNAATGVLTGELQDRDRLAGERDAERRRLWNDNAKLRVQLAEGVNDEPDPVLRDCARSAPPAAVRRVLQQHHTATAAH